MKFKIVNFLFSVYGINLLCGLCSSMTSTETFDASVSTTVPSSSAASTVTIQQPIAVSGSPSSLSSSTYSLPNSSSSISSSRSSLVSSPSSFPSSTSEFTRRPRPSRVSSNPPGVSRTTRTTTPLSTTIWDVVTRIITPNDLPCSILDEVKDINFELKYTPDEVEGVICKCWGVCSAIVLEDEFRAELQNYRYNPFEEDNWRERNIFIALVSVYSLVFIIGCTGNLIAIYGLLRWVKHKTPTFAFIISLSCCDLILLLVCMPIRVTEHFSVITLFIEATCKLSYYVRDFIRVCAVLTLTSISFERYYAICRPLEVQYKCTWPRARKIILFTWLVSTVLSIPTIFMTTFFTSHYADLLAKTCLPLSANDLYLYLYFCYYLGLLFVVPAIIMCCTYGLSCYGLWRSTQITMTLQGKKRDVVVKKSEGGAVQSKTTPKEQDDVTSRRRVIKLLILIVVIYIISWGTPLIAQLYAAFVNVDDSKIVRLVSDSLTFLSSSVNPYLFMIMSSKFVPKDHPCLRLCRRRRALTYSKAKGSSVSMTTATTSATNGRDEYANYS